MSGFSDPLENLDVMVEGLRPVSEMLSGVARSLAQENGWTEVQARDLVVAIFVASLRNQR